MSGYEDGICAGGYGKNSEVNMSRVTVVIPNYDGKKYIKDCFVSLSRQEYRDFQVVFVDNGSKDASLESAKKYQEGLKVQYVCLDKNYGFARAVNEGIRLSDSEYVILLNNDTKAGRHFIGELVSAMDEDDNCFSAQAKMLQLQDESIMDDAGDFFCITGWAYARGKDKKACHYTQKEDVFSCCAGAAIYRKSMLKKTGLFDENFFAYLEDVDIGYRARLCGYRNIFVPEAKVLHMGSATSGSRHNEFKVRLSARNTIYVLHKNFSPVQKVINFIPVLAGMLVKLCFFAPKGLAKAYVSGILEGLRTKNSLKVPDSEIIDRKNYRIIEKELIKNFFRRFGE